MYIMKNKIKNPLSFLLLLFIILSCTDQSVSIATSRFSLNGTWQFLASNEITETELLTTSYSKWDTIQVPGNWDTRARYSEYVGKGYFQKNIEIPKGWEEKQIRLQFDAVYQTSKVWLNGKLLGKHVGGYTPFEFNITDKVDFNKLNSIIVMADNTYNRGAWWPWGGISRNVDLVANENVRLVYQHISAEPSFKNEQVEFTIKYKIENNANHGKDVKVESKIDGTFQPDPISIHVEAGKTSTSILKFKRKLSDFKLWHFNSPNLYTLTSELSVNEKINDVTIDEFGIRKFEVRGEQFFLNNEPVRMNGVNRVHDHPDYGNTEPDHLVMTDMIDIKSLGCNFSRLMHAPLSENLLKVCDSIGFLIIEEIPVWGDDDPQSYPNNPLTKQWMQEMIERDFNHPSVVAWSVGNELREPETPWGDKKLSQSQYGYVNSMLDYVDELDTTRLKTYVTITSYRKGEIGSEPYEKVDFISMNSYGGGILHAKTTHEKFPGKPIFISEIGRGQIGPAPNAVLSDELMHDLNELKNLPYVTGVSLWSYNDYRSNYKGTPESGFREWGIVDERRNKKKAYHQLKEIYRDWEL
jgi:beta-galactosidase